MPRDFLVWDPPFEAVAQATRFCDGSVPINLSDGDESLLSKISLTPMMI